MKSIDSRPSGAELRDLTALLIAGIIFGPAILEASTSTGFSPGALAFFTALASLHAAAWVVWSHRPVLGRLSIVD